MMITNENIRERVAEYFAAVKAAYDACPPSQKREGAPNPLKSSPVWLSIGQWDVSAVTDMRDLFRNTMSIYPRLPSINDWNVSNVTNMAGMFRESSYNYDLKKWDVSKVTDMTDMFTLSFFNRDIGGWDVSRVRSMCRMFYESAFNRPIGRWNVSGVTTMEMMFMLSRFNRVIGDWRTGNVRDMRYMFADSAFDQDLDKWDVSGVEIMAGMFASAVFNRPIGSWDVSGVKDMSYMFEDAKFFDKPIGNGGDAGSCWSVRGVADMSYMFSGSVYNHPLAGWDVRGAENMAGMFSRAQRYNHPLGDWVVTSVSRMSYMFSASVYDHPLGQWDVARVAEMDGMFSNSICNHPLGDWNVARVETMSSMFYRSRYNHPLDRWNIERVADVSNMFWESAFSHSLRTWDVTGKTGADDTMILFSGVTAENAPVGIVFAPPPPPPPRAQGLAYDVHNAFAGADMPAVVGVLFPGKTEAEAAATAEAAPIGTGADATRVMYAELLPLVADAELREEIRAKLDAIAPKMRDVRVRPDVMAKGTVVPLGLLYAQALVFVRQQPPQFVAQYLDTFTRECTEAYRAAATATEADTTSCAAGMLERVLVVLGQAGYAMEDANYIALANALVFQMNSKALFELIGKCVQEDERTLAAAFAAARAAAGEEQWPRVAVEARRRIVGDCARARMAVKFPERYPAGDALSGDLERRLAEAVVASEMEFPDDAEPAAAAAATTGGRGGTRRAKRPHGGGSGGGSRNKRRKLSPPKKRTAKKTKKKTTTTTKKKKKKKAPTSVRRKRRGVGAP